MSTIVVIGEGAWGTAIATLLAENNHTVLLWCHDIAVKNALISTRYNDRYLPGIFLPETIIPVTDLNDALQKSSLIFEAIPVKFLRSVLEAVDPSLGAQKSWVLLSKGIEKDTLLFPTQLLDAVMGTVCQKAVLFGPNFAQEVAQKQISAATIAVDDVELGVQVQLLLANGYFRPYLSCDVMGVQVGGALKNVIALAVGMLRGAGYGDNTQTFVLTRGLHEMVSFARACGAQASTLYGLSGIGDLVLTALGKLSRNSAVGQRLGKGETLEIILQETGIIPESINTLVSMHQLMLKKDLKLPLLMGIYDVVFRSLSLADFLQMLMKQPLEYECLQ